MRRGRNEIAQILLAALAMLAAGLAMAPPAQAAADYYIEDDLNGGDCYLIGSWDNASKTCTLNRNISITGTNNGIEVLDNDITLDGAGYKLSLDTTRASQDGVYVIAHSNGSIKNLTVKGFNRGIVLAVCDSFNVLGNRLELNGEGLGLYLCYQIVVGYNTFFYNDNNGLNLANSTNNLFVHNDFIANQPEEAQLDEASIGNNIVGSNYWSDWDSTIGPENCVNVAPFDIYCDTDYRPDNVNDTQPLVIRSINYRRDWTWYDNLYGDNWVLLANQAASGNNILFRLFLGNQAMPLASVPGFAPGYVPPGGVIYNQYGVMSDPLTAFYWQVSSSDKPVASQRVLWPKGGSSLEEVPGLSRGMFDSRLHWSWYDMASPGFKNWILISNPNRYQINYRISIGGLVTLGTILANSSVAESFPGIRDGPVDVQAYNDDLDPVYVYASQRVLSNGDQAFNEVVGQPARYLSDKYVWTWYDQQSPGALNWVMVANPFGAAGQVYYEVWIAGSKLADGGPVAAAATDYKSFPGQMGGPVEVKCFANAAHTVPIDCIASQRSIWGPSFEEVPGVETDTLRSSYAWTWYDQLSPGALNWVMVANPSDTETINATVSFTDATTASPVSASQDIAPGGRWTPDFPGKMGGPVTVSAVLAGTTDTRPVIASQRVLWNGFFNEVWGQY